MKKLLVFLLLAISTTNATQSSSKETYTLDSSPMQTRSLSDEVTTQCEHGSTVYNRCNDECECQQGELVNCYRVRREFTQMSMSDRRRYIEVYKKASLDPLFVEEFRKLVAAHILMPHEFLHNSAIIFLPWHRWYLVQWENALRKIDCRITLPFWDWSRRAKNWWTGSDPSDVWNSKDHGLGGNGIPPENCVEDGPFKKEVWNLTTMAGGGCLRRQFNYTITLPDRNEVLDYLSLPVSKFLFFESFVRNNLHGGLHNAIDGTMIGSDTSSNAPEIILHHGFLDKIWAIWQAKGQDYKFTFFTELRIKLPFSSTYRWQWLDNDNLPGGIKIRYKDERDNMDDCM